MRLAWPAVALFVAACGTPSTPLTPPGPVPSAARFTLECTPHAIGAFDESRAIIPGQPVSCTAHLGDRLGAPVPRATVSFLTEAGRVRAEAPSDTTGTAQAAYETAKPLPLDVEPGQFTWMPVADATHTGVLLAPEWMRPNDWNRDPYNVLENLPLPPDLREPQRPDPILPGRTNNPRDNLVTVIAVVDGEEAFADDNGNGRYDPGEYFTDLTEPFVDANDDGTWNPGELFIDTNRNQQWDGANGTWNGDTKIWVQERLLWTGVPGAQDLASTVPGVPGHVPVFKVSEDVWLRCPGTGFLCNQAANPASGYMPYTVSALLSDPWLNAIARNGPNDGCEALVVEDPAPVRLLARDGWEKGPRQTVPRGDRFTLTIQDVRDPDIPADQNVPRRSPPVPFTIRLRCQETGTPGGAPRLVTPGFQGSTE